MILPKAQILLVLLSHELLSTLHGTQHFACFIYLFHLNLKKIHVSI